MGFFSRKNKASGEAADRKSRDSTGDKSMNRSASANAKQTRGRAEIIESRFKPSSSAPSSPRRYFGHSRDVSREGYYTTDRDAPPIPQPPQFSREAVPVPLRNPRRSSDYYSSRGLPTPSYDNSITGRHKPSELGHSPPRYADSGYESNGSYSALHSRAPSELNCVEEPKQAHSRNDGDFLPELRLGEHNLTQSIIAAELQIVQTSNDSYFHRQVSDAEDNGNGSPIDLEADFRLPKAIRSSLPMTKRTRFQDAEVPTLDQLQNFHCAPVTGSSKGTFTSDYNVCAVQNPFIFDEPSQESVVDTKLMNTSFPPPSEPARSSSSIRRSISALPPLSILEGFKVNKKGKILDEEGEPIGELVDGDLLDCVRQKANAQGEVIDDYGRVVGHLRTIHTGSEIPTSTGDEAPLRQKSQQASPATQSRSAPIRPALSTRLHSAPSLRTVLQTAEKVQQAQINVPSPIAETPRVGRPDSVEQQPELSAPAASLDNATELGQARASQQASKSFEELSKQVASDSRDFAAQEQPRRSGLSQSERSLSELSKPWARPNMTPVPENDVAGDESMPASSTLYAFKGEVPADDRPQREARSRSPHVAINAKAALAFGQPNSAMFGSGPRMSPRRRATTHLTGNVSTGTLSINTSTKPYRPSPLSSHETSPKRSDASDTASEDGRPYYPRAVSIAPSLAPSVYSIATSASKPRTYFTHGGKVTIDANTLPAKAEEKAPEAPPVAQETIPEKKKKKSRLSLGLGRKTVAK